MKRRRLMPRRLSARRSSRSSGFAIGPRARSGRLASRAPGSRTSAQKEKKSPAGEGGARRTVNSRQHDPADATDGSIRVEPRKKEPRSLAGKERLGAVATFPRGDHSWFSPIHSVVPDMQPCVPPAPRSHARLFSPQCKRGIGLDRRPRALSSRARSALLEYERVVKTYVRASTSLDAGSSGRQPCFSARKSDCQGTGTHGARSVERYDDSRHAAARAPRGRILLALTRRQAAAPWSYPIRRIGFATEVHRRHGTCKSSVSLSKQRPVLSLSGRISK